jgi:hypothetical protein
MAREIDAARVRCALSIIWIMAWVLVRIATASRFAGEYGTVIDSISVRFPIDGAARSVDTLS